jgi:hypothetical protein
LPLAAALTRPVSGDTVCRCVSILLGLYPAAVVLAWAALLVRRGRGCRDALITAAVDGGVWLVIGVEGLSLFGALFSPGLVLWWSFPAVLLAVAHRSCRRGRVPVPRLPGGATDRILLAAVGLLLAWAFVQAVLAPPNTADAITYHLPRQVYWQQQGSVAHYATSVLRQLTMPPFAEFTGLNLLLLSGGDRYHNLVQWSAMVGLLLATTSVAREMGGGTRPQLLTALFVVTIPSAFVQASSSKNDLVLAFWLAAALLGALRQRPDAPLLDHLRFGATLGLLVLTKGTGLVYAVPVAVVALRRIGIRPAAWPRLALVALTAAALNAGHVGRNVGAFASPYGPEAETHGGLTIVNEIVTPGVVASVAIRNLAAQLALPSVGWNAFLLEIVLRAHAVLGLSPDDPRTTFRMPPYQGPLFLPSTEDLAAAPAHVGFALLLPLFRLFARRRSAPRGWAELWLGGAAAFLLFCAALKWQLWHPRIVFPVLVFVAPVAGAAIAALGRATVPAVLTFVGLLLPSLNVGARPLLGPDSLFVTTRKAAYLYSPSRAEPARDFDDAVALARLVRPRRVGFVRAWNGYEYVFQVLFPQALGYVPRFSSVNALFVPRGSGEPVPDLAIAFDLPDPVVFHAATSTTLVMIGRSGRMTFYVPSTARPEAAPP